MALTNKDINIMTKMENLIGMNERKLFGENKDIPVKMKWADGTEYEITYDDFVDFICLIEKQIEIKKQSAKTSAEYHKRDPRRHNITNNIANARKRGDEKKLKYWQNEYNKYYSK